MRTEEGSADSLAYYRLHGAPRVYYSNYEDHFLARAADDIRACKNAWVIFDNTALSHAYPNAILFQELLTSGNGDAEGMLRPATRAKALNK